MSNPLTDDPAFSTIFEQHHASIHRYVRTLVRDGAEAEEITQETFLRAYRKLSSLQDKRKLSSWLYRIATNLCYDRFRQTASRPKIETGIEDLTVLDSTLVVDRSSLRLDVVFEQKQMSACVRVP